MLRMIARWFISRSIDEDRRLPDWLCHWIERHIDVKQFEMRSRQLGDRLKNDAPSWIASQALPASEEPADRRQIVAPQRVSVGGKRTMAWSLAAGVLAASFLFAVAQFPSHRDRVEQSASRKDRPFAPTTAVETISAADREWLVRSWKASRANLDQLQARASDRPRRTRVWKLPGVSVIVEPAKVAGSVTGRALATLDRGIETEQKQLTSDMRTALAFFAYRLPSSMAKLVGWRPPAA